MWDWVYELGELLFRSWRGGEHYVSLAALRPTHEAVISPQRTSKEYTLGGKLALWPMSHCSKRRRVSPLCSHIKPVIPAGRDGAELPHAAHRTSKLWWDSRMHQWATNTAGLGNANSLLSFSTHGSVSAELKMDNQSSHFYSKSRLQMSGYCTVALPSNKMKYYWNGDSLMDQIIKTEAYFCLIFLNIL